ncbi:hypothetical protein PVAP13_2NG176900 [Panicum virgatum]|uniref:Uncharacterized protein n=1 Tax=Panicum virgatum TaxID=38727 RepID=A0A8T0VMV6_PANVG|nr:hypothetical protein PVAP13_2NG176900 [Panicum virgatum]
MRPLAVVHVAPHVKPEPVVFLLPQIAVTLYVWVRVIATVQAPDRTTRAPASFPVPSSGVWA